MAGTYGMPFLLEDTTGTILDSTFTDIYSRMSYSIRCTMRNSDRSAYMIYDVGAGKGGRGGLMVPVACLEFVYQGGIEVLGSVKIGTGESVEIDRWLSRVSRSSSLPRKFIASDGQEYRWNYVGNEDVEWTCTNNRGYQVASYSLKSPREPKYEHSSGCAVFVEESYPHIVPEVLASLTIMRHIKKHNL